MVEITPHCKLPNAESDSNLCQAILLGILSWHDITASAEFGCSPILQIPDERRSHSEMNGVTFSNTTQELKQQKLLVFRSFSTFYQILICF